MGLKRGKILWIMKEERQDPIYETKTDQFAVFKN